MRKRAGTIAVLTLLLAACSPQDNTAQTGETAQVAEGHTLVRTYCADCHAVEAEGDSKFAPAPRFRDLHERYDVTLLAEALVEGIVTAHPEMPEFEFDPSQADAIIAYLKTLEPES